MVDAVAVAQPGLVVPKHHQYDGLIRGTESVYHVRQVPLGGHHRAQVVGQDIPGGVVKPRIGEKVLRLPPPALPVPVGAVPLVGDGEGEQRRVLLQLLQDGPGEVGQEPVVVENRVCAVHRAEVVLREAVGVEAQVGIHILPVVKPVVAGVAAGGPVALALEVAYVGGGVPPVVVIPVGHAGEEGPLGIDGAPGEDVGEQGAGIALRLQGVPDSVYVLGELDLLKLGEVGEGLQHDAHKVHLFVLRDGGVLILGQPPLRLPLVIALRGAGEGVLHAVQKGVEQAPGHILLGDRPLVDMLLVGVVLIHLVAGVQGGQGGGARQGRSGDARPEAPQGPAPGQQGQQQRADQGAAQGGGQLAEQEQLVFARHIPRLPQQQQVGGDHRVVPEEHLVGVRGGQRQHRQRGERIGQPGPAGEAEQQRHEHHGGEQVERHQRRMGKVIIKQLPAVLGGGQHQAQKPQRQRRPQHEQPVPQPEGRPAGGGEPVLRALLE